MNNSSEFELDQDLQLLPAWARQPTSANRYAHYTGQEGAPRESRRGPRPPRRERPRGEHRPEERPAPRPERQSDGPPSRRPAGRPGARRPEAPREPEAPLPEVLVYLIPEKESVERLARQIRLTGRAYPLFQIAALILKQPERYHVQFHVKKGAEGQVLQPLWVCSLDETVWLSEEEVAQHVLRHHFDAFYQTEKVACEPPKGTYTLVAQCGLSGELLGPPNYHDYQAKLHKLHQERFAHMPFEAYKARVKIVRDEAVVKQWLEDQSWKAEYIGLNLPEPVRFTDRAQVERHFRETYLPNLVKQVESHTLTTPESQRYMSRGLRALMRQTLEEQRRFPLKLATQLSQQLAHHGLHFFKVNKNVVHVCVARPHHLDLQSATVSDRVRRIMEFVEAHPGCTRRHLLDTLAPAPPPVPAPAPQAAAGNGASPGAPPPALAEAVPTPEQAAVISDLHWLIHQGHLIEFSDGRMETARPPKPKPPPVPAAPAISPASSTGDAAAAAPASKAAPDKSQEQASPPPSADRAGGPSAPPATATLEVSATDTSPTSAPSAEAATSTPAESGEAALSAAPSPDGESRPPAQP